MVTEKEQKESLDYAIARDFCQMIQLSKQMMLTGNSLSR